MHILSCISHQYKVKLYMFFTMVGAKRASVMEVDVGFTFFWARPFSSGQWAYKRHNKAVTLSKSNSLRVPLMLSYAWHGTHPDQTQRQTALLQMKAGTETEVCVDSHNS